MVFERDGVMESKKGKEGKGKMSRDNPVSVMISTYETAGLINIFIPGSMTFRSYLKYGSKSNYKLQFISLYVCVGVDTCK